MFFKKKMIGSLILSTAILSTIFFISSCDQNQNKQIKDIGLSERSHDFNPKDTSAYIYLGFNRNYLPKDVATSFSNNPTVFDIDVKLSKNNGCYIAYKDAETKTYKQIDVSGNIRALLRPSGAVMKLVCYGLKSNVDYDISVKAGKLNYQLKNNFSYMSESSNF